MPAVDDAFPRDLAARPRAGHRATQAPATRTTAREFTPGSRPAERHTAGFPPPDQRSAAPRTTYAARVAEVFGRVV